MLLCFVVSVDSHQLCARCYSSFRCFLIHLFPIFSLPCYLCYCFQIPTIIVSVTCRRVGLFRIIYLYSSAGLLVIYFFYFIFITWELFLFSIPCSERKWSGNDRNDVPWFLCCLLDSNDCWSKVYSLWYLLFEDFISNIAFFMWGFNRWPRV